MRKAHIATLTASSLVALAGTTFAQPIIDGNITVGEYGSPIWVNDSNPTSKGDNLDATNGGADGSEIDAIYAVIAPDFFGDDVLYVGFTGNLSSYDTPWDKLEIFFDTDPGVGQNQLAGDNPDVDFNGLNRMGDDLETPEIEGLIFDADFTANAWMGVTNGNYDSIGDSAELYYNFANLDTQVGSYLGTNNTGEPDGFINGDNIIGAAGMVLNSNTGGVTETTATGGASVTTGIEICIPLAAIGNPTDDILIAAFINDEFHDFVSSQIIGGHPLGATPLGEVRELNLQCVTGMQYATVPNGNPRTPGFILDPSPLQGGGVATLTATGANPGDQVFFVYSLVGFGSTFVPQLNVTLDLANPQLAGSGTANAQGVATYSSPLPPAATGLTVYLQAAKSGATTNAINCTVL